MRRDSFIVIRIMQKQNLVVTYLLVTDNKICDKWAICYNCDAANRCKVMRGVFVTKNGK